MNETLERNAVILQQRWPLLWEQIASLSLDELQIERCEGRELTLSVNGLQLSSRHDRLNEAKLQAETLPQNSILHLYGTGLGELPRLLLERPTLKRLEVHLLSGALFLVLLHLLEFADWLNDPRVQLFLAKDEQEIKKPFFALPPELILAEPRALGIRDRLLSELTLDFANTRFKQRHPEEQLQKRLNANKKLLRQDGDVKALFGTANGRSAYILASGPSLAEQIEYLQTIAKLPKGDRPLLIAVDTACRALFAAEIKPDWVVSIDYHINANSLSVHGSKGLNLVYFPMLAPELLESWQGARWAAYGKSERFRQLRQQIPKGTLYSAGSVIHPATDLAIKMGCSVITFFGADFGFPNGQTHAGWDKGFLGGNFSNNLQTLNGHEQLIPTNPNFSSYRCELERLLAQHPEVTFWNSSRSGAQIAGCHYHPELAP